MRGKNRLSQKDDFREAEGQGDHWECIKSISGQILSEKQKKNFFEISKVNIGTLWGQKIDFLKMTISGKGRVGVIIGSV